MFDRLFKKYKYENTRRYPRLPASWPIKCEPATPSDGKMVTQTNDISAGGVAITVRKMLPVGTRLQLEIHIPPLDRSLRATGRVVRCSEGRGGGFELGVRFDQIDLKDQGALREAIESFYGPEGLSHQRKSWWRKFA